MKKALFFMIMLLAFACNRNKEKPVEPEAPATVADPSWPIPDGGATIELSKTEVSSKGELVKVNVALRKVNLLLDKKIPKDLPPLTIILKTETPETIRFSDSKTSYEHAVDISRIDTAGNYSFAHEMIGYNPGAIRIALAWKWNIATEGCCSVALLAILAGCNANPACMCSSMAAMAAPGSWCCSIHPRVFRYYWGFYGCTGPSPY